MSSPSRKNKFPEQLRELYLHYNDLKWVHPDPLEIVLRFKDVRDREVVALLASSLAYGRVNAILNSVNDLLGRIGISPADFVRETSPAGMKRRFCGFKYRFHTGDDIVLLLSGAGRALREYGSLEQCFLAGMGPHDTSVEAAEIAFSRFLCAGFPTGKSTLLPSPEDGSACKRLNLMLRWLVRSDQVDPGGWTGVPPSLLVVPLDTHMHRLAGMLGLTQRKAADWKCALEITRAFAKICPEDPVRFDFSLTRFGIHPDLGRDPFSIPRKRLAKRH